MPAHVTSVNIACGFRAGDPHTIREAVDRAVQTCVAIGAHQGLPDRLGFGRREMAVSPQEVHDFAFYKIGALAQTIGIITGGHVATGSGQQVLLQGTRSACTATGRKPRHSPPVFIKD